MINAFDFFQELVFASSMLSLSCLHLSDMGSLVGSELLLHFSKLSQEAILLFFDLSTMTLLLRGKIIPVLPVLAFQLSDLSSQVVSILSFNLLTIAEPIVLLSCVSVTEFSKFLVLLIDLLVVSSFLFVELV